MQETTFKNTTRLTHWVLCLIAVQIVTDMIGLVSGGFEYHLLQQFSDGLLSVEADVVAASEANDYRQMIVGWMQLGVYVVTGFCILRWTYLASYNAHQLGAAGIQDTPAWSVAWYFIPLANLYKPYEVMKEIWQVSSNPQNWQDEQVPDLLTYWWFLFLAAGLSGNASARMSMNAETVSELISANIATRISDAISIPLGIVFYLVVKQIHALQMSHCKNLSV